MKRRSLRHICPGYKLKHSDNNFSNKKKVAPRLWFRPHHSLRKPKYSHRFQLLFQSGKLLFPYPSSKMDRANLPNLGGKTFRLLQKFPPRAAPKVRLLLVQLSMLLKVNLPFRDRVLVLGSSAYIL